MDKLYPVISLSLFVNSTFAASLRCLLAGWLFSCSCAMAQDGISLQINPEKYQRARATELKGIATHDSLLLAEAWYLYGKMFVFAGDYRQAQFYFLKALRVHEPRGDSFELNRLYRRLSEHEQRFGRWVQALRYARMALGIAERLGDDLGLAGANDTMGRVYENLWESQLATNADKFGRVLAYYRKVEFYCNKMHDRFGIADASVNIGRLFARRNSAQAIPYLTKAIRLYDTDAKIGNRIDAMTHLASAYLALGNTEKALETLLNAEGLYRTKWQDDYVRLLELEKQYVRCYQARNQWEDAFGHLQSLHTLEKRQLLADNNGAIARLNIEYETEKKEALLKAQNSELATLRIQRYFTIVTSSLLLLTAGLSVIFFRLYRKNQRISRQNAELVKEQNHRVKNSLQVVSSMLSLQMKRLTDPAARQAVEESQLRIQSMAILHRRLYDGEQLAKVNLEEFIPELVSEVLRTFGFSFLSVQYTVEPVRLSADKATPLGLILNELVTNACKYAFPYVANPALRIACRQEGLRLTVEFVDNGPGLADADGLTLGSTEQLTAPATSFGMVLIQTQVEQLNGTATFQTRNGLLFTLSFTV